MARANYELIDRQRDDLMKAYREIAPNCHSQQEAWEKVVHSPAPRYYVSPKRAWDILRRMAVGDFSKVDSMKPIRQKLYYTLFNRMDEMTQRKEFVGKSLWFICQFLVSEPAPEFFIQPSNLKFIFAYYKKYGKNYREMDLRKKKLSNKAGA